MIFTAPEFWLFFVVVLLAVFVNAHTRASVRIQNAIYLLASYFFYAQWDWRFLSLVVVSTLVDFLAGRRIGNGGHPRGWLLFSLGVNLSILAFFKYFGFFLDEAVLALRALGVDVGSRALEIILPLGISFYTFQTLTYTIDIYRGRLKPTSDLLAFATYVAFFPQLVAGPIERAANLLPQFSRLWRYDEARVAQGLRLILAGMFLKVVVADNLAPHVDRIFAAPHTYDGGTLALGSLYFAFQIYGDFCGYSTIAIGVALLLNVELMTNFRTPYLATSIRDFWRQWHISLSTFFRDYLFIPLGGSRGSHSVTNRNLVLTFAASGIWHGANWTFLLWGLYHGLLLIIENRFRRSTSRERPGPGSRMARRAATFGLVCIGWVFFRSPTVEFAFDYLGRMVSEFGLPRGAQNGLAFVAIGLLVDVLWRRDTRLSSVESESATGMLAGLRAAQRWALYSVACWLIVFAMARRIGIQQFIYFQF